MSAERWLRAVANQSYPGAVNGLLNDGPAHTFEAGNADVVDQLRQTLLLIPWNEGDGAMRLAHRVVGASRGDSREQFTRSSNRPRRSPNVAAFVVLLLALGGCRWWDALFQSSFDRTIWSVKNRVNSSKPFFDDSAAYFLGNEHQVTAVDKRTGKVRWSVVLPVSVPNTIGFGGVMADGKVVIGDADVFALEAADGKVIWRFTPAEGQNPGITFIRRWNNFVLTGSTSGHVFAIDARDGTQAWARRLVPRTKVRVFSPVIADDGVFVGFGDTEIASNGETQGGLAALDAATGAVRWLTYLPHNVDSLSPTAPLDPALAGTIVGVGVRDGPALDMTARLGHSDGSRRRCSRPAR